MEIFLFWVLVGGIVGAIIGDSKGRMGDAAVLGAFLGPIGWLIVAVGPNLKAEKETRACPFCAELVKREAIVCKHCGREIAPVPPAITTSA